MKDIDIWYYNNKSQTDKLIKRIDDEDIDNLIITIHQQTIKRGAIMEKQNNSQEKRQSLAAKRKEVNDKNRAEFQTKRAAQMERFKLMFAKMKEKIEENKKNN